MYMGIHSMPDLGVLPLPQENLSAPRGNLELFNYCLVCICLGEVLMFVGGSFPPKRSWLYHHAEQ